MKKKKYYKIATELIPLEILEKYDLKNKQIDIYIYVRLEKWMHGLVQSGIIEHEALKPHLKSYGYGPSKITQGLWTHQYREIRFILVVENFGIKYRDKKDADHLIEGLQSKYEVTQDWTGGLYCSITLKWDYAARILDISMPGYAKEALDKFQQPTPTIPQHSPYQWIAPNYGPTAPQLNHPTDNYPALNPAEFTNVQQVVGKFLYYVRAVKMTMLVIINSIAAEQKK